MGAFEHMWGKALYNIANAHPKLEICLPEGVERLREIEFLRLNKSKLPQPLPRRFLQWGTTGALDNAVERLTMPDTAEPC